MSTTQPPSSTASPPSTSSSVPSSLNNTSTLLFGLLVSALSIFSIFTASAIIWNRLVTRRRAIDATLMMNLNPPRDLQWLDRPTTWDVWVTPDRQTPPWTDVKPVAAQKSSSPARRAEQTVSFWRRHLLNRLPPEIAYLLHRPIPQVSTDTNIPQVELLDGSDIQISFLITMPRAPQSTPMGNQEHRQRLQEVAFATTNVLCHDPVPS